MPIVPERRGRAKMRNSPFENKKWQAMARECSLASQLIGSGATALGKASYADGEGNYYVAFFGLSVGIERLAKLILVADYAINNEGDLPKKEQIRKFGHNISDLLKKVNEISLNQKLDISYKRPSCQISTAIITCLDSFADAKKGRYANFEILDPLSANKQYEPVSKWWNDVAEPILQKHYFNKAVEKNVVQNAEIISQLMDEHSLVLYRNENGGIMQDLKTSSIQTGQTKIVQKFGRFYTLQIVRWLASVFIELSRDGEYKHQIDVLFGHYELFYSYSVEDHFLKNRKIWPLK